MRWKARSSGGAKPTVTRMSWRSGFRGAARGGSGRRATDRDENGLAIRIQALGADRSRLADKLDGSLVKSRRLERTNREIAERLDAAISTIRSVLDAGETS